MSTSLSQPYLEPPWKQEVNQRLAAHRNRKGQSAPGPQAPTEIQRSAASRAAQAAARVAARYANAPSYSEMQAEEAHAALRAAELATRAALEAQAVASIALDGLRAASAERRLWEAEVEEAAQHQPASQPSAPSWEAVPQLPEPAPQARPQAVASRPPQVRWDQDLPARPAQPQAASALRQEVEPVLTVEEAWDDSHPAMEPWEEEAFEPVEPALPIHANLIEFPRELVAAHKVRPRLAEGPLAPAEPERQLSIFEVDPGAIAAAPEAAPVRVEASSYAAPEWSRLELEEQLLPDDETLQTPAATIDMATFGRRLLASVVDGALISGAFLGATVAAVTHIGQLPPPKIAELSAGAGLVLIALLYQSFFSTFASATPGMKYARVSLCTFNNRSPNRSQILSRLGALLLSVLPVGLGLAWAIFDENHLCWHDRLSQTYLRKC